MTIDNILSIVAIVLTIFLSLIIPFLKWLFYDREKNKNLKKEEEETKNNLKLQNHELKNLKNEHNKLVNEHNKLVTEIDTKRNNILSEMTGIFEQMLNIQKNEKNAKKEYMIEETNVINIQNKNKKEIKEVLSASDIVKQTIKRTKIN